MQVHRCVTRRLEPAEFPNFFIATVSVVQSVAIYQLVQNCYEQWLSCKQHVATLSDFHVPLHDVFS